MNITPIRNEVDYHVALTDISELVDRDPALGTADGDRLDILATLVDAYESEHFPLEAPTPIEAIRFRMEQDGLTVKDLVPYIGSTNRVYEVLNGTRPLSLRMIRSLNSELHIPAQVLIGSNGN